MLVKACGLRSLEEISWAHELGFDFWGIVLEPKSRRYVPPTELKTLWQSIPDEWKSRCVFVARKWRNLSLPSRLCTAALLQCYDGFPQYIATNRRFLPVSTEEQWQLCRSRESAAYYLYDVSMGTGLWYGLPDWCRNQKQLFVAGGLDQNRLQQLAAQERGSRFFGFDLSSGLEDDGHKDYRKMEACIGLIRSHFLDICPPKYKRANADY